MSGGESDEGTPSGFWRRALWGQLAGIALATGLVWLQAGTGGLVLFEQLDGLTLALLGGWLLTAGAQVGLVAARAPERPLLTLLVGLAPLVLAVVLASMTAGNRQLMGAGASDCGFFLAFGFSAERLRVIGLLASGSIWLGCVPVLLALNPAPDPVAANTRWPLVLAAVLLAGSAIWTFFDPLLPATGRIGGTSVRGMWALAAAVPIAWLWWWGMGRERPAKESGWALAFAAWFGLIACAWSAWLLHRADGLYRVLGSLEPEGQALVWPAWFGAGLVLSAALLRLLIPASLLLIAGLAMGWRGTATGERKRTVAFLAAVLVLGVLSASHERDYRAEFDALCLSSPSQESLDEGVGREVCGAERRVFGVCLSRVRRP